MAFFLYLVDDGVAEEAVKAQAIFSLLDIEGNPVSSYTFTTSVVNFSEKKSWGYKNFIKRESLENPQYLKDDCFSIRIDLAVLTDYRTEETPLTGVVPPSDMHRHYGHLLLSKEGVDVEFQVGNKTFDAHRLVLAARSSVFRQSSMAG
uniref:BTB domain-containing protein n=1 Tax=Oryza punctata TaxID=4537 RepID=A0A0E0M7U5_ORYPU